MSVLSSRLSQNSSRLRVFRFPIPAPPPPFNAPAWKYDKCDVQLDSAGVGQCHCTTSTDPLGRPQSPAAVAASATPELSIKPPKPAAVFLCPPCCDESFQMYGLYYQDCVNKTGSGCRILSHSLLCLTGDPESHAVTFAPCVDDGEETSSDSAQRFVFESNTGALRPKPLPSLCLRVDTATAGATVLLGDCGDMNSTWSFDRASAPQDNGASLVLASTPGSSMLCLRESPPKVTSACPDDMNDRTRLSNVP